MRRSITLRTLLASTTMLAAARATELPIFFLPAENDYALRFIEAYRR